MGRMLAAKITVEASPASVGRLSMAVAACQASPPERPHQAIRPYGRGAVWVDCHTSLATMLDGDVAEHRGVQHGGNPAAIAQREWSRSGRITGGWERHVQAAALPGTTVQIDSLLVRFCRRTKTSRPPGRRPRPMAANAAAGPAKNITPQWLRATSPAPGGEAVHRGVAVLETGIAQPLRPGAAGRLARHRRGQAQVQGPSVDCGPPSRPRRGPGAATDAGDPADAPDGSRGQQVAGERRQHARVALLVGQPMGGLTAAPVAGLLLVRRRPALHGPQSTPSSTLEVKCLIGY